MRSAYTTRLLTAKGLRAFGDGFVSLLLPLYLAGIGVRRLRRSDLLASITLLGSARSRLRSASRRTAFTTGACSSPAALMAATGAGFATALAVLAARRHRAGRHPQSVERRHHGVPAARARGAGARRRCAATARPTFARYSLVGTLVAARGRAGARCAPAALADAGGWPLRASLQGDVRSLRAAGRCGSVGVVRGLGPRGLETPAATARVPLRRFAARRVHAGGALQPRRVRRRLRRPVDPRAVALPALRAVAGGRRFPVLRDRRAGRASRTSSRVRIAERIGLVNTMVFTHLPANCAWSRFRSRRTWARRWRCSSCAARCRRWTCRPAART